MNVKLIETTNQHQHVKTHWEPFSNMWMSNIETSTGAIDGVPVPMGPKPPIMEDLYYQFLVVLGIEYYAVGIPVYSRTWANDFVL